ncbi:hypothetical protein LMG29542_08398 [Paraburkholderia humisilvae]|uniref:HTH cro/C1-type domain-containing protein n=1 Tax=Paraburkholderia humisilvae TaxID=627669 RepID=A0A6J5FCM1_9BURK|nr:hypothetical protein LMG29542_08398 [Paraburkholderia humisilvae]
MTEHEKGSTNVCADLGYADAKEMLVKAKLVTTIREIIKTRGWTQQEAATVLGIPQPKLSNILRGQFRGISESELMLCLPRLGRRDISGLCSLEFGRPCNYPLLFSAKPGILAYVMFRVRARWEASDRQMIGHGAIWKSKEAIFRTPGCIGASRSCWRSFGPAWGRPSPLPARTGRRPRPLTGFCPTTVSANTIF